MPEQPFDPSTFIAATRDTVSVRQVFGEAYERDGTLVVPVAKVLGLTTVGSGGAAGPSGPDEASVGAAHGGGGVLGARVVPVGVYEVTGKGVRFRPTFDLNRAVLGGQIMVGAVLVTALLTRALRRR